MNIISPKDFRSRKKSDTLIIYGSGFSIKSLTDEDLSIHEKFDSVGFNWFCKSNIPTTFYVIREQGNIRKRRYEGERPRDLFEMLAGDPYKDTTLIIHDQMHHTPEGIAWHSKKYGRKFNQDAVVIKDIKLKTNDAGVNRWRSCDMFKNGLIHGEMSLNNVLHFSVQMGYSRLLFSGVDLNDSRYFWLGRKESRATLRRKGKKFHQQHTKCHETVRVLTDMRKEYEQQMFVYNSNSMLTRIMPVWGK